MTASQPISRRQALQATGAAASLFVLPQIACSAANKSRVKAVMTQGVSGLTVNEIARSQGFFDEFNLDPEILQVSDGTKCVAALLSGAAQICVKSGFNQLTPAIERGAKIKILAGALNLPSLAMYSARPDVQHVADLEGKVVGIGSLGSVLHQMTAVLLRKKGVNVDTVKFRNVGNNAEVLKAVITKTIDAGLSDVDVIDQQQKFGIHALSDGLLWKEIPEYTNQGMYASDTAIKQDRELLVRVLAAYGRAYRFVCSPNSRDAFIKARQKATGSVEPSQALTQWKWIQQYQPYALNLTLTEARINLVQRINVEFKAQRAVMPFAAVADMSLAREALKLLV